jgi:hypothetical protein
MLHAWSKAGAWQTRRSIFNHSRRIIMNTLTIDDLAFDATAAGSARARTLSSEEMKRVSGGRAVSVLVDGRTEGTVDDFSLNMEIFKGNIGGPMIL